MVGMVGSQPSATGAAPGPGEPSPSPVGLLRSAVLAWYRPRPKHYPWRTERPDPYAVLVSEVMLQQTQAPRVAPAYRAFLERFPDVRALSSAARSELLRAWGGLGYPRRALALREAARTIVRDHDGRVPADVEAMRSLPGVGPYTAAAVASIAFGVPVAAVDTNVRRIVARVVHGAAPDGIAARRLQADADEMVDRASPGEWNQALMDLGRFVCRPLPRCGECPMAGGCRFALEDAPTRPSARRRQPAFDGSARQARGRVLAALRERGGASVRELAADTEMPVERTSRAAAALARDGLVSLDMFQISVDTYVSID
jgi:A/G-specific adenine glycosylase